MEKCSNFKNCGNTFPEVEDDEIPFQFCSEECKEYIIKKELRQELAAKERKRIMMQHSEDTQGLIDKRLLLD